MAKKIVDEDMVLNIIINGDKGRAELNKLERAIKDLSIANEELAVKKNSGRTTNEKTRNSREEGLHRLQKYGNRSQTIVFSNGS